MSFYPHSTEGCLKCKKIIIDCKAMILSLQCLRNMNVVPKDKMLGGANGEVPGGVGEEIGVNMIKTHCINA